ncbi:unnamed protein product, partial [Rotaria sp. Silwood2]
NSVWIGILIEFEADERILRAEYINPVNGFDVIQDTLQKQLSKVYSFAVLRSRNILTHHDHRGSATLTVKNLLQAVKDEQYPDFINPTPLQSHNSSRYENTTRTYLIKKTSLNDPEEDTAIVTSIIHDSNEGKANTDENFPFASSTSRESELLELREKLKNGLTKINLQNVDELAEEIKETKERVQKFQRQQRTQKAQEESEFLRVTGSGKSTTIQFLAGATMKEVRVQISPGKYLEHVTAVGSFKNPELNNVTSSSLQKSETRFIAPVTIQLEDVLGAHESGEMILCDAPGFGDTAGPEVDIANSIGVIEALKEARSVKL